MPEPAIGDVVWMNCRATEGCEGHDAKIVRVVKTPVIPDLSGTVYTTTIVYRCGRCNRVFSVSL